MGKKDKDISQWEDEGGNEPSREEVAEQVVREADMMKIRILVAVNGHHPGDPLTVDRNHPFYGGLVDQGLAEIVD